MGERIKRICPGNADEDARERTMVKTTKLRKSRDRSTYNTTGLKRGGSVGRRKGSKNKTTIERELRAQLSRQNGDELGVDRLRYIARAAAIGMAGCQPFNDDGSVRRGGNTDTWFRYARLLFDAAVSLAPFETPKLAGLVVTPPPPNEPMTLNIFDQNGKFEKSICNGEVVAIADENDPYYLKAHSPALTVDIFDKPLKPKPLPPDPQSEPVCEPAVLIE